MNDNLSKVYAKSAKSEQDYREYPEVLREAVSIARRMQVIFWKNLFLFLGHAALWEAATDIKGQKISKANHFVLNSPKKERWDNFHYMKLSQRSFFGTIEDIINCFGDLLTIICCCCLSPTYLVFNQYDMYTILASGSHRCCCQAIVWQSSGSRLVVIGAVVKQFSGSHLAVVWLVWQLSGNHLAVIYHSSGSRLAVVSFR